MEKKLQELIDSWKNKAKGLKNFEGYPIPKSEQQYISGKHQQLLNCISEAEELLKQHIVNH